MPRDLLTSRPRGLRSGFTIIEMLVVISVLAMLMAILLPAVSAVRATAANAACANNIRQVTSGALLYATDHRSIWPGYDTGPDPEDRIDRKQLLRPYLLRGESNEDVEDDQVWHCRSNSNPDEAAGYGFNTRLNWVRITQVRQPARTVGIVDAGINDDREPILATHAFPPSAETFEQIGRPNPRHGSEADPHVNTAFVDGSVSAQQMEEPFYPGPPGEWFGNGVTDHRDPEYKDELWDLR